MTENRISATLQALSHVLAVGAALVYFFGYVIVSVFDATYGIADFSLFRTKVIAVGALFVFLVALGMLLTFRMFSMFGLTTPHAELTAVPVTDDNRMLLVADVAVSLPLPCFGLMWLLTFLFDEPLELSNRGFSWFLLIAGLTVFYGILSKKLFNAHPYIFIFLSSLNTAAFSLILFRYFNRASFWFVFWLSAICLSTLVIALKLREPGAVRKVEWERIVLAIFPVVFFLYATKVYPKIKHHFGGGAPIPIVLHLTKKVPPFESETAPVSLIDETESGYYVSRGSDKAVFVSRPLVEAVEFLRAGQSAQSPALK